MVQVDETGHIEVVVPLCPWCEEPLNGRIDGGLHEQCAEELAMIFDGESDADVQ